MTEAAVTVHELIGWDMDEYSYRSQALSEIDLRGLAMRARTSVANRPAHTPATALLTEETNQLFPVLAPMLDREDLRREYDGLQWTLGVVDLRRVLAFQRRLVFDDTSVPIGVPRSRDWPALLALAVDAKRSTEHRISMNKGISSGLDICIQAPNPDLQLVLSGNRSLPMALHGGSPFFEVAELNGRWFLRDGYHRAFHLLRAGVHAMIAVVIRANTIHALGATEPYFFGEDILFSPQPPCVVDFLSEDLVITYRRPKLFKTIRIQIEETLEPINGSYQSTSENPGVHQ